ncbi:MAG: hypothetical protein WC382_04560 [Methanoregulaceae archaeon]|jgi:hypothetical protein
MSGAHPSVRGKKTPGSRALLAGRQILARNQYPGCPAIAVQG